MSFYNLIHGVNEASGLCLKVLGLTPQRVPRFRDAYFDGSEIVVLTRTGGGNRAMYEEENERLRSHPLYRSDADDSFDCTFALFRFKFPAEQAKNLQVLSDALGRPDSLQEKTERAAAEIEWGVRPVPPEIEKILRELNEWMRKQL